MIPINFLEKTGIYDINIKGKELKVRFVDHEAIVDKGIAELRTELSNSKLPVVAVDVKTSDNKAHLLLLRVGSRCVIIQNRYYIYITPESLLSFMNDETICFVGVGIKSKLGEFFGNWVGCNRVECKTGVEVGDLAARVLKNPSLSEASLPMVAREIGVVDDVKAILMVTAAGSSGSSPSYSSDHVNWSAKFFSTDEVKQAILEVCAVNLVGEHLLNLIV